MVENLTGTTYSRFLEQARHAVVLFDAPAWNASGEPMRIAVFPAAARELRSHVKFGFVDIDQELELANAIQLMNVPTVAYYRDANLVAALIGARQDVPARAQRLLEGQAIGYGDGLDTAAP